MAFAGDSYSQNDGIYACIQFCRLDEPVEQHKGLLYLAARVLMCMLSSGGGDIAT